MLCCIPGVIAIIVRDFRLSQDAVDRRANQPEYCYCYKVSAMVIDRLEDGVTVLFVTVLFFSDDGRAVYGPGVSSRLASTPCLWFSSWWFGPCRRSVNVHSRSQLFSGSPFSRKLIA